MKKPIFTIIQTCFLVLMLGFWQTGFSQVNISTHNTDFNTNFNGWNNTLPTGFTKTGANYVGTSAATTGGLYAISGAGFGYQPSGTAPATSVTLTGTFKNTTGSTITSLQISYDAFQIVYRASRLPGWAVTSSLGTVSGLNWSFNTSTSPSSPDNQSITLTGLNVANNATFTLTFFSDRGTGSNSSPLVGLNNIKVKSILPVCDDPTNLAENNVTATNADFDWDADGSNNFEYVLDQSASNPTGAGTTVNGTSYSTSSLLPSTTYYFHLRQNCGSSFSNWVYVNFTTPAAPCIAPSGLTYANTTHNASDLSWNSQGSNSFEYVLNQTTTDPTGAGTPTTDTTYNATSLTPLTTYYLHVRTNCGSGNFSPWTTISFTTLVEPCAAPTGLTAANTTHEFSSLSWNTQGTATFEYVLDQTSTDPAGAGTSITDTTYDATALTPLTTYYMHVRADCGNGNFSPWISTSFTTLVEPCDAPTGLTSTNTTHQSSDIFWNAQGTATFEYVFDQSPADPSVAGTPTTDTTYDATALTPLTTYYLHLRSDCGSGNYSQWITLSFTTLIEPCDAPTGLADANTTHNASDLSWNAQGSSSFEYVVDQNNTDPAAGTPTTDTTYNATSLIPSTTYYLHVRTNCVQGNTSAWTTIPFTTLVEPCDAPTGLADANTTHNASDLSWNAQGSNSFEYVVDQNNTDPAAAGTPTTDTTYDATALTSSTTYYLHVRTDCGNGNYSPWVTVSFTTLVEPCDAPTGLTAANTTYNASDLSWNAQESNSFEYVVDQTNSDPAAVGTPTTDTTYDATALTSSTTYYLHVRTDCGNGNYSPWVTISFTTLVEPCAAPTGLASSNVTAHGASFNWTAQTGSSFEYFLNQSAGDPSGSGTTTANTTLAVSSLMESTTYYFHVRRDCGNGNFSDWTTISFTTPSTLGIEEQGTVYLSAYPNPAQNLVTITGQTQGTITLNNLKGQQLASINLEQTNTVDLSAFESGIYFLVFTSESKTAMIKLIKQ